MSWILKIVAAVVIWVFVGLIFVFVGGLLLTVNQPQIAEVGKFFKDNAYLLGFLAGAWFLIWGKLPSLPPVNR